MATIERSYVDADLPRVLDLLGKCLLTGYVDAELLSTNLRIALSNPEFDRRNTRLLEQRGELAAFAILWQGRYLGLLVHPDGRGTLEPAMLAWADSQAQSAAASDGLVLLCRNDDPLMTQFCEEHGFRLGEEELRMGRELIPPLPDEHPPAGISIRPLRGSDELEAWLALYTESFGSRPAKLRHWRVMREDPDHRSELDLVAITTDGRLAGMCYCSIASFEASILPHVEGRTEPVAVDHEFQRQGLGQALICAGLQALRRHGAQTVILTTEADNAGAHRLYESLGYREWYRACWYRRTN